MIHQGAATISNFATY